MKRFVEEACYNCFLAREHATKVKAISNEVYRRVMTEGSSTTTELCGSNHVLLPHVGLSSSARTEASLSLAVHILIIVFAFIIAAFFIIFVEGEQLVLPLFARLIAVLSGVATSFFRKGKFIMVEAEGDGGVPVEHISECQSPKIMPRNLHSITSFGMEQQVVDSVKDTLESSVGSPVTVEDTVADAAVAVDVGME